MAVELIDTFSYQDGSDLFTVDTDWIDLSLAFNPGSGASVPVATIEDGELTISDPNQWGLWIGRPATLAGACAHSIRLAKATTDPPKDPSYMQFALGLLDWGGHGPLDPAPIVNHRVGYEGGYGFNSFGPDGWTFDLGRYDNSWPPTLLGQNFAVGPPRDGDVVGIQRGSGRVQVWRERDGAREILIDVADATYQQPMVPTIYAYWDDQRLDDWRGRTYPAAPSTVARAQYQAWVSWGAYNVGLLSFDHSTMDGADVFGVSPFDASFGGTHDDVSSRLRDTRVSRGRNNNLDTILAGSADIDLRDPAGLFNPDNQASPLAGQLADRLQPVKLTATLNGTESGLFYGWVRRFLWEPEGRRGVVRLECVDLFYWLERADPVIASTGATTTGAAVGKILDAIGFTDAAARDLDTGDAIPDFAADGSKNALELIQTLLEAERGVFYISGAGKATYRSRDARLTKTSAHTFADVFEGADPGVDWDQAYTRITVRRTQSGYTATAYDSAVVAKVGYNDLPTIATPYLASDAQAEELAVWLLSQHISPRPPMRDFSIDSRDPGSFAQALERDLVDRITVISSRGSSSGDYHIDSLTHSIDGKTGRHTTAYLLSKASPIVPGQFDVSTFDGGAVFVY